MARILLGPPVQELCCIRSEGAQMGDFRLLLAACALGAFGTLSFATPPCAVSISNGIVGDGSWSVDSLDGGATFVGSIDPIGSSEEHTSVLQSLMRISYSVFCWKRKIVKLKDDL